MPMRARWNIVIVIALLMLSALLALVPLLGDSVTFDETSHVVAGLAIWRTGEFRLAPDHPPLAKLWCTLPLVLTQSIQWPYANNRWWNELNVFQFGRKVLFELNDGERLVTLARLMMLPLLLLANLAIYFAARRCFGGAAALLALAIAVFSPEMLAHGHLVTTDLPITLLLLLCLLCGTRVLERPTASRLAALAGALAAAALTKLSWPLILPPLVVMAFWARFAKRVPAEGPNRARPRISWRAGLGGIAFLGLTTYIAIWAGHGFRATLFDGPRVNATDAERQSEQISVESARLFFARALLNPDGSRKSGILPAFLEVAGERTLLPEPYLLGLAMTAESTSLRRAYFCGEYSQTGWRLYFPLAFLIKTPLATLALLGLGIGAVGARRVSVRDSTLLVGLAVFAALYLSYAVFGNLNIGHRHLLPIYPTIYILAGAAVGWAASRIGRIGIGVLVAWLVTANLWIAPHYLSYFNEAIGGPARGHLYLADSNIDWGQDLKRLAAYCRNHPDEEIMLGYFGSAVPTQYEFPVTALPSYMEFDPPAALTPGAYVVSVTQLLGVFDDEVRASFWTPEYRAALQKLGALATHADASDDPSAIVTQRREARIQFDELRRKLLLARLRDRAPDDRIGWSLLVFRISQADIDALLQP